MRLFAIISMAKDYLVLGIAVAAVAVLLFVAGYAAVYKRICKGKRRIRPAQVVWAAVFVCYLVVVLGAVMLGRSEGWGGGRAAPLFYSYRHAWYSVSASEWRNIVLNILMFVPLGFLLPLGIKWFRTCYRTYIAGFLMTVCIELAQLVLRRGVCEMDDIVNNTVGTMIGYGVFAIVWQVLLNMKKRKQPHENSDGIRGFAKAPTEDAGRRISRLILLQLPLAGTVAVFAVLFVLYQTSELGNLECQYAMAYDMEQLDISSKESYSDKPASACVYQAKIYTEEETHKLAEHFFAKDGEVLDESRTDLYDETAVYYSKSGNSIWIDYKGGSYSYANFDVMLGDESSASAPVSGAAEETIREQLAKYGIEPVSQAEFSELEDGQYEFAVRQQAEDGKMSDGTISCALYVDGVGKITNRLLVCEEYQEYDVLSEQEAYQQICEGKFDGAMYAGEDRLDIRLGKARIKYDLDSKGFYQPVYAFAATVNGEPQEIRIPAIR